MNKKKLLVVLSILLLLFVVGVAYQQTNKDTLSRSPMRQPSNI